MSVATVEKPVEPEKDAPGASWPEPVLKLTLTPAQVTDATGIATSTLSMWRSRGIGPNYVRLGERKKSRIVYRVEDLDAFFAAHVVKTDIHGRREPGGGYIPGVTYVRVADRKKKTESK